MNQHEVHCSQIASFLGTSMSGEYGKINWVTTLDKPLSGHLAFCNDAGSELLDAWDGVLGAIIAPQDATVPPSCAHLMSDSPRRDFGRVLDKFFVNNKTPFHSETAQIHPTASIGDRVSIGHNVVIEADVMVGDDTIIGHNSTLLARTRIGERCTIGSNTVIGSVGFGLERDEAGTWFRLPHVGGVTIGDDVEIGSSSVVARGTIGNTTIKDDCKIDDNVFIAHNVVIEENVVVIANSEVSGSVHIKRNSWIAPATTIIQGVSIGENSLVGIGSVVIRDVPDNVIVAGNPAKVIREQVG